MKEALPDAETVLKDLLAGDYDNDPTLFPIACKVKGFNLSPKGADTAMQERLFNFIRHARQIGMDHATIRFFLLKGWREKDVAKRLAKKGWRCGGY